MPTLRNLGTTDKKSSRKIKYKKISRVHILKTAQNKKICFAPESASKPTNCYAATLLPQSSKYSKSADLLRKSLLPHVWADPKFKSLLLQAGTALEFGPLASSF